MSSELDLASWLHDFVREPVFLARYPHYAAILARLHPVADPSVLRMAVSLVEARFYLHVNVESFVAEPHYLRGVLLHEVHHIALGHLGHPKFQDADEPELMDLALEISANEYIQEPLPDPIVWSHFAAFGIGAGQSTLERYHLLAKARREGHQIGQSHGAKGGDPSRRVDDHQAMRRSEPAPGAVEHTRQLVQQAIDEVAQTPRDGDSALSAPLLVGREPELLVEDLYGVHGEAQTFVDWKTALRMFLARKRAPVHTWARPNRRFVDQIGRVPGRSYSPRVVDKPSLLVAIDTSMSMTGSELAEISRQLVQLATHARLTIAECDAEIARTYPFTGVIDQVVGRGGTDLRPVFGTEFLGAHHPDGVIYFTDGRGPFPSEEPTLPVLWLLSKPGRFRCPWGERAELVRIHGRDITLR